MSDNDDIVGLGCFIVGVLGVTLLSVAGFIWIVNQLTVGADMAQIERLRIDAAIVDPVQAEDVIGQVTVWNQRIVSNQTYERMPIINIMVPDEWSRVEVIEVPRAP
jgi:hypothetical protein